MVSQQNSVGILHKAVIHYCISDFAITTLHFSQASYLKFCGNDVPIRNVLGLEIRMAH